MPGADASQPLPFRGARPFDESSVELYFGRRDETAAAVQLALSVARAGVILGEPGVGVTSLLRAGLVPALREQQVAVAYADLAPPVDPTVALSEAVDGLANAGVNGSLGERVARAVRGGSRLGVVLIIDHLDLALTADRSSSGVLTTVATLLGELLRNGGDRLRLLFGSSEARFFALGQLEATVGPLFPGDARLVVPRFDGRRAAEVVEQSVLTGGVFVEAGFAKRLAEQVCADGPVLGLDLQLLMVAAARQGVHTAATLRRAGGADALKRQLLLDAVRASGGRTALRLLDGLVHGPTAPAPATVEQLAQAAGLEHNAAVRQLASLEGAGLVALRMHERQSHAALAHEALLGPVRELLTPHHLRLTRARQALRTAVERKGALLPMGPRALLAVWTTLGTRSLRSDELEQVERSLRWWLWTALGLLGLPLVALLVGYGVLSTSYYLALSNDGASARGEAPEAGAAASQVRAATLVVRQGRPSLRWLFWLPHDPAFGAVLADTGFSSTALSPQGRQRIKALTVTGWTLRIGSRWRSLPRWWPAALTLLDDVPRAMAEALTVEQAAAGGVVSTGSEAAAPGGGGQPSGARGAPAAGAPGGGAAGSGAAPLGELVDQPPSQRLLRQAAASPSRLPQVVDALAVAGSGTSGEAALLDRVLRSSDERLRQRAVWAIGAIGLRHAGVFGELLARVAAQDPSSALRRAALAVASSWAPSAQTPVLAAAIEGLPEGLAAVGGRPTAPGSPSDAALQPGPPGGAEGAEDATTKRRPGEREAEEIAATIVRSALVLARRTESDGLRLLGALGRRNLLDAAGVATLGELAKRNETAFQILLRVAKSAGATPELRALAAEKLMVATPTVARREVDALLARRDVSSATRMALLLTLARVLPQAEAEALAASNSDGGPMERYAALSMFGVLVGRGDGAALDELKRVLAVAGRRGEWGRAAAAEALGEAVAARNGAARGLLLRCVRDPSAAVRLAAVRAFCRTSPMGPAGLTLLTARLADDPATEVQLAIASCASTLASSLGDATGPVADGLTALRGAVEHHPNAAVRARALRVAAGMRDDAKAGRLAAGDRTDRFVDELTAAAQLPESESSALRGELTADASAAAVPANSITVALVERELTSPSERSRTAAVALAGQLPPRFRAALALRLREALEDPSYDVRQAARLALARALAANERAEPLYSRLQSTAPNATSRFVVTEALAMRARSAEERRVLESRLAAGQGTAEQFLTRASLVLARTLSAIHDDLALDRTLQRLHGAAP